MLGLVRFVVVIVITVVSAGLVLYYHQDIMQMIWTRPDSAWIVWLWHAVSWLLTFFLVGLTAIVSYLVSQILFSVFIMDAMSRITEQLISEQIQAPATMPLLKQFIHLVKQEIPRTTIPVLVTLLVMIMGWATPLGPVLTVLSSAVAVIFLTWDNTDLVPARRLRPFSSRFGFLLKNLPFHLGFGLLFLIPGLNILFLSFAPVGATMYHIEQHDCKAGS
jgi:CysZ protein